MKKLAIITVSMLLAVTAFGQQNSRERTRPAGQDHKSEATVRRSTERSTNSTRDNTRSTVKSTRQKPGVAVQTPTRPRTQKPAGTVRTHNGQGQQKPAGTVRTHNGNGQVHAEHRTNYTASNRKPVRMNHAHHTAYKPVKYRKGHKHYRAPNHTNVIWTHNMYREYRMWYPDFNYWYYPMGYRITNVPYYNAYFHIGEVRNVYGRVHEVWYSWSTDEYYLYFGASYPYQNFTVIVEGRDARRFSRHPEAYFGGRYIWVTGLVSTFEGKPEILVKRNSQIHLY